MLDLALIRPEKARPLRRAEYDRLVALGTFEGEHVELLRGATMVCSRLALALLAVGALLWGCSATRGPVATVDDGLSSAADDRAGADGGRGARCWSCGPGMKLDIFGSCVTTGDPYLGCAQIEVASCPLPNAIPTCDDAGVCATGSCAPGWANCSGLGAAGCETDVTTTDNCGACDHACAVGQVCKNGKCAARCIYPDADCGGTCADVQSSANHCGSCTTPCPAPSGGEATCVAGTCGVACNPGLTYCGVTLGCRDGSADPQACGASCTPCGLYGTCTAGVCGLTCPYGQTACGSVCVLTSSDAENCGACGHACGGSKLCVRGECREQSSLVLASVGDAGDVIVDGASVLYIDSSDASVHVVPLAGGASIVLATGQATPERLAADGTYVYWSNYSGNSIMRALEDGTGAPEQVVTASAPWSLAVDGKFVYWNDTGTSLVVRAPKDGRDGGALLALATLPGTGQRAEMQLTGRSLNVFDTWIVIELPDGPAHSYGEGGEVSAVDATQLYYVAPLSPSTIDWYNSASGLVGASSLPAVFGQYGYVAALTADACGAFAGVTGGTSVDGVVPGGLAWFPHSQAPTYFNPVLPLQIFHGASVSRVVLGGDALVYAGYTPTGASFIARMPVDQ